MMFDWMMMMMMLIHHRYSFDDCAFFSFLRNLLSQYGLDTLCRASRPLFDHYLKIKRMTRLIVYISIRIQTNFRR